MLDLEASILGRLRAEWTSTRRPLFLVDEVRAPCPDRAFGEFVSFVLVGTNTQLACAYADDVSDLRDKLQPSDATALIKGADLYGNGRRKAHDALRARVRRAVADCDPGVLRFTTSSSVLKRYEALAPGGIRPVRDHGEMMPAIRGRELVPLMTMVKIAANIARLGPVQVDVLLDRSAQLGLDPRQLGEREEHNYILGPGELNHQADGSPASLQCSSRFQFIAPTKRGPFRDLALLPDAVAYVMRRRRQIDGAWRKVLAGEPFVLDGWSGADIANELRL